MATHLLANGESRRVKPFFGSYFSNSELREFVEGDMHIIGLLENGVLVINKDHHEFGLEENVQATKLAKAFLPDYTYISGPALHIPHSDFHAEQQDDDEESLSAESRERGGESARHTRCLGVHRNS